MLAFLHLIAVFAVDLLFRSRRQLEVENLFLTHRYRVPFNGSGVSYPVRLLAGYTTNTSEIEFSVHTPPPTRRSNKSLAMHQLTAMK
jgi:hypothetical protein